MLTLPINIEYLVKNYSNREVAILLNISNRTLSRRLKEYGLVKIGWGAGKLNYLKAKEIRRLYDTNNYNQQDLAEIFGVSRISIWKVINEKTYPKPNMHTQGSADVKLTILYEGHKYLHGN